MQGTLILPGELANVRACSVVASWAWLRPLRHLCGNKGSVRLAMSGVLRVPAGLLFENLQQPSVYDEEWVS